MPISFLRYMYIFNVLRSLLGTFHWFPHDPEKVKENNRDFFTETFQVHLGYHLRSTWFGQKGPILLPEEIAEIPRKHFYICKFPDCQMFLDAIASLLSTRKCPSLFFKLIPRTDGLFTFRNIISITTDDVKSPSVSMSVTFSENSISYIFC